jgi:hypothetical protein
MFIKDGKKINLFNGMVIDDVQLVLPVSPERLAELGITEVPDPARPNEKYYDVTEKLDGSLAVTAKDLEPLKAAAIADVKRTAGTLLAPTAWYIERLNDPSSAKPVPDAVLAYRAAVRQAGADNEAAIAKCKKIDALAAFVATWPELPQ